MGSMAGLGGAGIDGLGVDGLAQALGLPSRPTHSHQYVITIRLRPLPYWRTRL